MIETKEVEGGKIITVETIGELMSTLRGMETQRPISNAYGEYPEIFVPNDSEEELILDPEEIL